MDWQVRFDLRLGIDAAGREGRRILEKCLERLSRLEAFGLENKTGFWKVILNKRAADFGFEWAYGWLIKDAPVIDL